MSKTLNEEILGRRDNPVRLSCRVVYGYCRRARHYTDELKAVPILFGTGLVTGLLRQLPWNNIVEYINRTTARATARKPSSMLGPLWIYLAHGVLFGGTFRWQV